MTKKLRSKIESDLQSAWHRVVGPSPAGDNIFEIGDDIAHAARLVVELKRLGHPVTMGTLVEHPTIESLTRVLLQPAQPVASADPEFDELWKAAAPPWEGVPQPVLVPITEGAGRPIFFVHPGSGNITFLRRFAEGFRHGHPVYGFESIGIRERRRPLLSTPEMAELYLAELYRVQPQGPYLLAGICSGCDIAHEMACRISDEGREVRFLALINALRPGWRQFDPGWGPADLYELRLARMQALFGAHDLSEEIPRMMAVLKDGTHIDDDAQPADFYWHIAIWGALAFAKENYEPRTYAGPAHVFLTTRTAEKRGGDWTPVSPNSERMVFDVTNSFELMATERFADAVGKHL